jgi:hypothetical protein
MIEQSQGIVANSSTRGAENRFQRAPLARKRPLSLGIGCLRARLGLTFAAHCIMSESRPPSNEPYPPTATRVCASAAAKRRVGARMCITLLDSIRYGDRAKNSRSIASDANRECARRIAYLIAH